MKRLSFRLQIALLSALLTSALLAACGYVFWQVNEQIHIHRMDRELRSLGSANLDRAFGRDHWMRLETALDSMGGSQSERYILLVRDINGGLIHQSKLWPASITPELLPVLARDATEPAEVLDPASRLHRAPPPARPGEPISRDNPPLPHKAARFVTVNGDGHDWRVGVMGNPYLTVAIGVDLAGVEAGMGELQHALGFGLPLLLLGVAAGGWWLAGLALKPVHLLTQAAETIHAHGLDQRLDSKGHAREFQRLIDVFNAMLGRLEKSFHQANRFTADAAHELRTPLTILQGEMEQSLQHTESGSSEQRRLVSLIDEVQHLKAIVEKLLLLSQADAGKLPLDLQPVNVSEMLHEVIADVEILADGLRIDQDIEPDCIVHADPVLLHQLVQNLSSNALRYNQTDGHIRFALGRSGSHLVLVVANTGPMIPEPDREKIFERFHRADASRNRSEGIGLGLAIAREIARAHGGDLVLCKAGPGETAFQLSLPL